MLRAVITCSAGRGNDVAMTAVRPVSMIPGSGTNGGNTAFRRRAGMDPTSGPTVVRERKLNMNKSSVLGKEPAQIIICRKSH